MIHELKSALQKWSDFEGRARRKEFWTYSLVFGAVSWVVIASSVLGTVGPILSAVLAIAMIAVAIRRMHDVGKSGWFCLIPIYNLILALTAGDVGPNEYGADPKGGSWDISDHLNDSETV